MSSLQAASIHFSRRDIASTSSAAPCGMVVYPPTKKGKQRVAVGDRTGVMSVFSVGKRLDQVRVFTTAESDQAAGGEAQQKPPVSCAFLFADQLFCVRGSVLDAYSRKGKHFFSVDTNATERIHSLSVHTPFFFISGEFMVTSFREMKELGFFMAPDRVAQMIAFPVESALAKPERDLADFILCLGCNDRMLRMVRSNKLLEEVGCEAAITALHFDETRRQLYYGTQVGSIGVFDVVGEHTLRRRCSYIPRQSSTMITPSTSGSPAPSAVTASIACLSIFDINRDGKSEVLVGYEDGTVQVFAITGASSDATNSNELQSIWCGAVGERVVSVVGGAITQGSEQPDVLVHLFSGLVVAFTLDMEDADQNNLASVEAAEAAQRHREQREAVAAKRVDTEADIARLQAAIAEKAKLLAAKTGATAKQAPLVAVASTFTAEVALKPVDNSAMLSLVIDADVPLDCAILHSTATNIAFFGTDTTQVSAQTAVMGDGSAPLHSSPAQNGGRPQSGSSRGSSLAPSPAAASNSRRQSSSTSTGQGQHTKTLAVATPLAQQQMDGGGGKRLEVLLWADEGSPDVLTVTLYAAPTPRTAQVKSVPLTALPLYRRVGNIAGHFDSPSERQLALSSIRMTGDFTTRQAAEWLRQLLPDLAGANAVKQLEEAAAANRPLCFFSGFLGTVLSVERTEAAVVFTSDSLTALLSIKRHMVRQATLAGRTVATKDRAFFGSARRRLELLRPLMTRCAAAARQVQLLEGLRELQSTDTDLSYLSDDHQRLLDNAECVLADAAKQRRHEVYLKRSVVALYHALVQFCNHAPALTPETQASLEAACCGASYSELLLSKMFFPNGEDVLEQQCMLASASSAHAAEQQQQQQRQLEAGAAEDAVDVSDTAVLSPPSGHSENDGEEL